MRVSQLMCMFMPGNLTLFMLFYTSLGQGVNSALEDVRVFDEVLGDCSGDLNRG